MMFSRRAGSVNMKLGDDGIRAFWRIKTGTIKFLYLFMPGC